MTLWGGTDILGLSGKQQAASIMSASSGGSSGGTYNPTPNAGASAVTPSQVYNPTPNAGAATITPGTGNPGTLPGHPPVPGDRWQGGAPSPNGTQAPNGQQTGGRYVDPTYQTDATGRQLSPTEQQAWRDYDTARANASTREQAGYQAYKKAQADAAAQQGQATNAVYDPISQTWSMVDSKGVWTKGLNSADLQGKLDDNLKKQYPDWWWGQYASQQNLQRRYEVDAGAFDAQKFASMGQTDGTGTTRYGPTNF